MGVCNYFLLLTCPLLSSFLVTEEFLVTAVLILTKRPYNPVSFWERIEIGQVYMIFSNYFSNPQLLSDKRIS